MFNNSNIKTDRFIIRPFKMSDASDFHYILNQKEVLEYLPEETMSIEDIKEILEFFTYSYKKNTPCKIIKYTLAIEDKASGKVIGWCGFGPLDFDCEKLELYYGLAIEHWGKGIATEASKCMLKFAFENVGCDNLAAVVKPENKASIRVIEKLGFKYIKTLHGLPAEYDFYEGEYYYEIKKEEYKLSECIL